MTNAIRHFVKLESASGILLIVATILALVWANTPFSTAYQAFINLPVAVQVASLTLNKPLLLWINDGMMAIFFLVVGLEVKRELMMGALASRAQALFPAIAALGGMVMPALIYLYFNGNHEVARQGWAIPVATDIAFSLGVMALLGKRVPTTLKVFLLALAIIDDLGAILIITLFYTHQLSLNALVVAGGSIALLAYLNRSGVSRISPYILVGVLLWFSLLHSGIHATLAGVITGFFIPLYGQDAKIAPLQRLEHKLHPWVAYLILPLFAFANAGVSLQGLSLAKLSASLPLGIVLGLFIGKPLGIFSFSWLSVQLNLTRLPSGTSFPLIFGVSVFCGIGFTMSMFIAALAFEDATTEYAMCARLGILMGSTMAAVIGYWLLHYMLPRQEH